MNKRQQQADFIAREIARMGAWCINPMPLDDDAKLRFQVLDTDIDKVVRMLCESGFLPARLQVHYRVTTSGLVPATLFEIDIPHERQPIPDRKIYGEVEERKKTASEVAAVMKHLGRA
jgi:hypothetical protein